MMSLSLFGDRVRIVSRSSASAAGYLPAFSATYLATASISACERSPLKEGIPPPPFSTWCCTVATSGARSSRFGPTPPLEPAAASVWQFPQPAEANTFSPSAPFAGAVLVVLGACCVAVLSGGATEPPLLPPSSSPPPQPASAATTSTTGSAWIGRISGHRLPHRSRVELLRSVRRTACQTLPVGDPAHALTADSSHRPRHVKPTITVSIQYCERTAARASSRKSASARSCASTSAATCPATSAATCRYQMPVAEMSV